MIDKDFANYRTAARLAVDGRAMDLFADHEAYFRHMSAAFGPNYPWHNWSYPPHFLLLIWPFGFMRHLTAMAAFLIITAGLYMAAARAFVGPPGPGRNDLLILLLFITANLWAAQNGFLTGALLLGCLALRERRPVRAVALIAMWRTSSPAHRSVIAVLATYVVTSIGSSVILAPGLRPWFWPPGYSRDPATPKWLCCGSPRWCR